MVNVATLNHQCPSCGAPVTLSSINSKTIECKHCNSLLTLNESILNDLGQKSFVLKDASSIKIGTVSFFNGLKFTFIGRYQVGYELGFWNEWCVLFENGKTGWVTDTDNGWYITCELNVDNNELIKDLFDMNLSDNPCVDLPKWDQLKIDSLYDVFGRPFLSVDISENKIVGIEGEIDYSVSIGSYRKAIDLRSSSIFLTADYTKDNIEFFIGKHVVNPTINSGGRTNSEIMNSLGSNPNELSNITCPNCGDTRQKILPNATSLFCSSCNYQIQLDGNKSKILDAHEKSETRFSLDNQFLIYDKTWNITGILKREGSDNVWVDYFLTETENITNTLWLSESVTYNSFYLSTKLNFVPKFSGDSIIYDSRTFSNPDFYNGKTIFVSGTFNWEVNYDDEIFIYEYDFGDERTYLVKEVTINDVKSKLKHEEVVFSVMTKVSLIKEGVNETDSNIYRINTKKDYSANNNSYVDNSEKTSSKFGFYSSFVSIMLFIVSPLFSGTVSIGAIFFASIVTLILTVMFYPFDPDDDGEISTYKIFSCGFIAIIYLVIAFASSGSRVTGGTYVGGGSSWGGSYGGSSSSYSGGGHK